MIADDLFAGAGGWDLAAHRMGIHARGVENMKEARATREAAGLATIHDDVWTFDPLDRGLIGRLGRRDGETNADVYARVYRETGSGVIAGVASGQIASPPCQTFSQAGKGSGRKALDDVLALMPQVKNMTLADLREAGKAFGDDRTALVLTPLWFLLHHSTYRWAAWEQVPTVLPVWEACADVLRTEGWSAWTGNLQAEQYGVPQTRKRAFLLASRDHEVTPPTPTHSRYYSRNPAKLDDGVQKWVSMAEALGWPIRTRVVSNYGSGGDPSARGTRTASQPAATVTSKVDRNVVEFPSELALVSRRDSDSWKAEHGERPNRTADKPAPTVTGECHRWKWSDEVAEKFTTDRTDAERAWPAQRPSPTVVGSFHPEIVAAPGYRTDVSRQNQPHSVRITVAEAGVLQSFPADHPWKGTKGKQFLQAGNAVPPLLAEAALCAATGRPFVPTDLLPAPAQPALATA